MNLKFIELNNSPNDKQFDNNLKEAVIIRFIKNIQTIAQFEIIKDLYFKFTDN